MTKFRSTAEQKKIIKITCGNSVVNACAGSGKTTTLVLRTKHLIENGYNPEDIAIITYSKALAKDIETKLSQLIDPSIAEKVTVLTIHSMAFRLVKKYYRQLGFKQKPKMGKNALPRLARKAAKKTNNIIGFKDMIKLAVQLLDEYEIKLPFRHLMVDELQDIDPHQTELLKQLSPLVKSMVMVGDPLQLIYGWRQASPDYWLDIIKCLKPKQYCLTESFRIPQQSLSATNRIARSIDKNAPKLTSQVEGEKPVLFKLDTAERQYIGIAGTIKKLVAKGVNINKIAILGKTKRELMQTAIALRSRQISVIEHYRPVDENRHKEHLGALIQLTRLEQVRIGKSSKTLNRDEQEQAKTYLQQLWLPQKVLDELITTAKKLLGIKSDHSSYNRINDLVNAIRKAAVLANVESALQCLIDASKPIVGDRGKGEKQLLLRELTDIKLKASECQCLKDVDDSWFEPVTTDCDAGVQLLTCHSAKGQEWDYVFIINVVDGVFPRHQQQLEAQEEEARVFYVALTRHRIKAYLLQSPVSDKIITKQKGLNSLKPRLLDNESPFIKTMGKGLVYKDHTTQNKIVNA